MPAPFIITLTEITPQQSLLSRTFSLLMTVLVILFTLIIQLVRFLSPVLKFIFPGVARSKDPIHHFEAAGKILSLYEDEDSADFARAKYQPAIADFDKGLFSIDVFIPFDNYLLLHQIIDKKNSQLVWLDVNSWSVAQTYLLNNIVDISVGENNVLKATSFDQRQFLINWTYSK